ncbi:hypothetical protein RND71_023690 [Anisodus tanguticus]|uniref:VQ domain-containing protein n=1 Tax=Anisodus tanguticus TaxID=243964 RepID=A0AAE1RUV3_9SOLA|nr:hypothetical protein RND71_023690 [Anisodus tanguticus]
MNHAQFYDHATKVNQTIISISNNNNNNNNVSSPLKINKASHFIKKSSSNLLPSSSSSSSLYNGVAAATSTTTIPSQQPRHPVIIYTHSPKVIHTHPRDFMALVQKLTGLSPEDDHSSPSHPPQPMPQHPKFEPINEEDLISCSESCLGDILGSDKESIYHTDITNNINNKTELLSNDDNESTSVVTDENNGSYNVGDNSSASCYVPPPPIFDLANISDNQDINSGISDYNCNNNNLSDPPCFFDSNLTPFDPSPITNSTDFFFSDQQLCNYTNSMFFMSSMRNSFSSSSSDSTKELPDY